MHNRVDYPVVIGEKKMTAKDYLRKLKITDYAIVARMEELERLDREQTYLSGIDYTADRVQTSPKNEMFPKSDKRLDLALRIKKAIRDLQIIRERIISEITGLENANYSKLLYERYVNYKSFEEIACMMGYSYVRVIHMHGEALQAFSDKYLPADKS